MTVKHRHLYIFFSVLNMWLFAILILCGSSCAENGKRIKIVPNFLNDIPAEYKGNVIVKPPDFVKGVLESFNKIVRASNLTLEVMNLSEEESLYFFSSIPIPDTPERLNAEYFFSGGFDNSIGVFSFVLVSVETARTIEDCINIKQLHDQDISMVINEVVQGMFQDKKAVYEITTVKADAITDAYNSIVEYKLQTEEGVELRLKVGYDGFNANIQTVNIELANVDLKSVSRVTLLSNNGDKIYIDLVPGKKIDFNKDITPDYVLESNISKDYGVVSKGGYEVIFQFQQTESLNKVVKIYPSINPYAPQVQKLGRCWGDLP